MSTEPDAPDVPNANAQTDSARTATGLDNPGATAERDEEKPVPCDGLLEVLAYVTATNAELYVAVMEAAVDAFLPAGRSADALVIPAEMVDQLVNQTSLGRLGEPDDIADAVAFVEGLTAGGSPAS